MHVELYRNAPPGLPTFIIFCMKEKKKKDWFKLKRYPHIGFPLTMSDRSWVLNYIQTKTSTHSFLPFIHRTSKVRRFRKQYCENTGIVLNEGLRVASVKPRELYYASHLDSAIYSYYTQEINDRYERFLSTASFQETVLAYRQIPVNSSRGLTQVNKCTIDFAKEVFDYIVHFDHDQFVVMTFDVSSFFDNLNHKLLLKEWCKLLNVDKLAPAHFNIYKSVTRFNYVELVELFTRYQDQIITEKNNNVGKTLGRRSKRVSAIKYLRNQNAVSFCSSQDFFKNSKDLIKSKRYQVNDDGKFKLNEKGEKIVRNFGIPQGTPISALLSNIYMIPFDETISTLIGVNGLYRRYCDDIIIVCSRDKYVDIRNNVYEAIKERKLEIQEKKTQTFHLHRETGGISLGQEFSEDINYNKKLTYLGFEFDGRTVRLKSASLSSYYRKLKRGTRRGKHYASKLYNGVPQELFKNRLYKRYSHLGAKRTRLYIRDKSNPEKFIPTERYNWGNFLSYVYKADSIFKEAKIRTQVKRHWTVLNKLIMS